MFVDVPLGSSFLVAVFSVAAILIVHNIYFLLVPGSNTVPQSDYKTVTLERQPPNDVVLSSRNGGISKNPEKSPVPTTTDHGDADDEQAQVVDITNAVVAENNNWRCACEGGFLPPGLLKSFGGAEAVMRLGTGQCYHQQAA